MTDIVKQGHFKIIVGLVFLISMVVGIGKNQDTLKANLRSVGVSGGITLNFNQPFRDVILNTIEAGHKRACNGKDVQKSEPKNSDNVDEPGNETKYSKNTQQDSKPAQQKKRQLLEKNSVLTTQKIVAFHATLTSGDLGPNYEERLVKFNDVQFNVGKGYNRESGKFIAPEKGIYMFAVNALQKNDHQIFLSVKKQGKDYSELHSSGVRYDSHSVTLLMQLDKGEMTWVELQPSNVYAIYGKGKYTSFCGYLVARL